MSGFGERLAQLSRSTLERRFVLGEVLGPPLQIKRPPTRVHPDAAAAPPRGEPGEPVGPGGRVKPAPTPDRGAR